MGKRARDNRGVQKSSCKIGLPLLYFDITIIMGESMNSNETKITRKPLPSAATEMVIGTVPDTNGLPKWVPSPDQLPLAYDPSTGILYFYTTEWKRLGLNSLSEVDLSNLTNLDNVLRIPVSYVTGNQQVEGYITLKDFKKL